ncbi:MAG TPA: CoA transferase, partial [Acidimicrobiales bacterium]|nr:CoA transferase [Acidimicrobiales bacterium]
MSAGPGRSGPLSGIRVIELANYVSAPLTTMMLADLGADVVKIEPPKGDPFRRFGRAGTPVSPLFVNTNRGKQGLVLDLKDPEDNARLHELLEDADVLVSNWRPSVAERLGLADDALVKAYPQLIRVYVTGFGPSADAPVFDAIIQAHVGAAESSPPTIAPTYIVDKVTACMACQATVAALFDRERNGTAERIDLALLDAAAYFNFVDVMANRTFVDFAPVEAKNEQASAIRPVETADGWLIVAAVTAEQIRRTCEVLGRPALA